MQNISQYMATKKYYCLYPRSSIKDFGWGIGDRTKSIRIPSSINDPNAIGYIEDRRPASNGDPYQIVERMVRTILPDDTLVEY